MLSVKHKPNQYWTKSKIWISKLSTICGTQKPVVDCLPFSAIWHLFYKIGFLSTLLQVIESIVKFSTIAIRFLWHDNQWRRPVAQALRSILKTNNAHIIMPAGYDGLGIG